RTRLLSLLSDRFRRAVEERALTPDGLEEAVQSVLGRHEDPYSAAERLYGAVLGTSTARGRVS
ncbi:MAG TPA: hypothetical protein VGO79_07490, partial [Thermoanaerobaculia bacterium]